MKKSRFTDSQIMDALKRVSQYHWRDLDEVRLYATNWMWMYNHERPNMALGGITPKQRLALTV